MCIQSGFATGKLIATTGETVVLRGSSDLESPNYTWTLTRNNTVVNTQNASQYSYTFSQEGLYVLNLTVESRNTLEIETTQTEILIGTGIAFSDSLQIIPYTFPPANEDGIILVRPNTKHISIFLKESKGSITQYAIDTDIGIDSDNDGNPANDIDNFSHSSYTSGAPFNYPISTIPVSFKTWVSDSSGNISEKTFTIQTDTVSSTKPVNAILQSVPEAGQDRTIRLYGDSATVYLYSGSSLGNIEQYWIDTDIHLDSDGDLDPANDKDNAKHASLQDGSLFPLSLRRTDGDRVIQLTVIGKPDASGKRQGSRIQRKIVWDDTLPENTFRLIADAEEILAGERVQYAVSGLRSNDGYEIKWDFNGDKKTDYTSSDTIASYVFTTPGSFETLVQIKHEEKKILKYQTLRINVLEAQETIIQNNLSLDFHIENNENFVTFTPIPMSGVEFQTFDWRFGDGIRSTQKNARHLYLNPGTFQVQLMIRTSTNQSISTTKEVSITQIIHQLADIETLEIAKNESENNDQEKETSTINTSTKPNIIGSQTNSDDSLGIFQIIIRGIVFLLLLLTMGIVGYMIYLKIKNPDYTLSEIFEEEKERILFYLEEREIQRSEHEKIQEITHKVQDEVQKTIQQTSDGAEFISNTNPPLESSPFSNQQTETPIMEESIDTDFEEPDISQPIQKIEKKEIPTMPPPPPPPQPPTNTEDAKKDDEDLPEWLK